MSAETYEQLVTVVGRKITNTQWKTNQHYDYNLHKPNKLMRAVDMWTLWTQVGLLIFR